MKITIDTIDATTNEPVYIGVDSIADSAIDKFHEMDWEMSKNGKKMSISIKDFVKFRGWLEDLK